MHTHSHHEFTVHGRPDAVRGRVKGGLFTWSVTFFLLSLVAVIFDLGGTVDEPWGHYAKVTAVGFLVLALVIFFFARHHGNQS
jgi:uncharacterized membrane protein YtjA (UPF0391 family)